MVFMFVVGFALTKYFNEPGIIAVISFMVYILHALYLPIYLLSSLRTEGKTQLWLHNPNSGSKLFLAKIAAGLTLYMVSFLIVLMITYWTINLAIATGLFLEFQDYVFRGLVFLGISITFMTIYLGIWVIFYWTIVSFNEKYSLCKKYSLAYHHCCLDCFYYDGELYQFPSFL